MLEVFLYPNINSLKKILFFFIFFGSLSAFSQEKFTLSGTISEAETGETLIGVNVIIPSLQTGTVTNQYGYYSITLPTGEYEVVYSSIGFAPQKIQISLSENIKKRFRIDHRYRKLGRSSY